MVRRRSVVWALAWGIAVSGSGRIAAARDVTTLDALVVEAAPVEEPRTEMPSAFVTVIRAADHVDRASSVPELLEATVGVNVRRFGGLGAFTTMAIRGSSAQQVTVLLDGVPLNQASSGVVDLSTIPLRSVERIEVFRGFAPLRLRGSAIGGVVNVVTKRPGPEPVHEAGLSYGSFQTYEGSASSVGRAGPGEYVLAGSLSGSEGDFEFVDDNGTRVNPGDDTETKRRNNDFRAASLLAKYALEPLPGLRLEVSNDFFDKQQGVPGIASNQSENARLDTRRDVFNLRAGTQGLGWEAWDGEVNLHGRYERTRFRDPEGEIGIGRQDNTNETREWGLDGHGRYYRGEHQTLSVLAAYRRERFESRDELASGGTLKSEPQKRSVWQFGLEDELAWRDRRLLLTPQLLYTYLDNDFGGDLPGFPGKEAGAGSDDFLGYQFGAKYQVTGWLSLRANAGRAYRVPTLNELFGDRGTVVGNPGLKPERAFNWDVGLGAEVWDLRLGSLTFGRAFLELAYFSSDTDDLILFEQVSQRTIRPVNISKARVQGVELNAALTLFEGLRLSGNYTYQHTRNRSDIPFLRGNRLPGRPAHQAFARAEYRVRWLKPFYEFNYLADNFLDRANFEKADSRRIHNLGLSLYPRPGWAVTAEVKNLTDEQVADVLGFPLPGRSYMATAHLSF